jgi:hypothetical protein
MIQNEVLMKKNITHIAYHITVVVLSAAIAFSLPFIIKSATQKVLTYWSVIENEQLLLISMEVTTAVLLIVFVNALVRSWKIRKLSHMAQKAGMVAAAPAAASLARRQIKKLKEKQGFGRSVMLISSTGFRTFADATGDLHQVLRNCREAKIMLLDPLKDGVIARAKSLADPTITPESFRDQIIRSIDFLKGLKANQKNIRLKLYQDVPLLKVAILGDYLCLQHYPTGLNARTMPEYVFKHDQKSSLFSLFYQYFVNRWFDPAIPEYDLATDELIYRDKAGNEMRREQFNEVTMEL